MKESGASNSPDAALRRGLEVANGDYQLISELGRGGFGWVWKALNRSLHREVALKFFVGGRAREDFDRLVAEEGPKLAALSAKQTEGWEHILIVHRCVVSEGDLPAFLELELMGGSLRKHLERGPLPEEDIQRIALQIGRALLCAHRHGVVHCDLKPDNILCDDDKRCFKLSDFGLSFKLAQGRRRSGGTPRYMAFEQFGERDKVGPAADLYALGCVLYECIEGRTPFVADERVPADQRWDYYKKAHREEQVERPANSACSEELKGLVMRCLEKDPSQRPAAAEVVQQLQAFGRSAAFTMLPGPRTDRLVFHEQSEISGGVVVSRELDLHFRQEAAVGTTYFPQRLITQTDFLKFTHDPRYTRWNPQAVRLEAHDGGYLPEWFQGRPRRDREHAPLTSVPYDAAEEFSRWAGGELPELSTLIAFFEAARPEHPVIEMLRELQAQENLPFLQLWCRDDRLNGARAAVMYRFGLQSVDPTVHELHRLLRRVERPPNYCFRSYLFLPIVPEEYTSAIQRPRQAESQVTGVTSLLDQRRTFLE